MQQQKAVFAQEKDDLRNKLKLTVQKAKDKIVAANQLEKKLEVCIRMRIGYLSTFSNEPTFCIVKVFLADTLTELVYPYKGSNNREKLFG